MPKFFLHIRDNGRLIEDPDGIERPDLASARKEAIAGAREILAGQLIAGETLDGQQIEICSETGEILEILRFSDLFSRPKDK